MVRIRRKLDSETLHLSEQRELVEAMFHEALKCEPGRVPPVPSHERPMIHYTELPEAQPDSPLRQEWSFYRREVGRLLADGQEGRFVLIKGDELVGIWDTHEEAKAVALQNYLMQPCLIHQIRSREPLLHEARRPGWPSLCRSRDSWN